MKNVFLFNLKSFFSFSRYLIFCISIFLSFVPVSHCLGGWSKINLKVYDVINCLNKNLITHFAWYLGIEESYDIETFSIDKVLNKKHFNGKIMQKICVKDYSQTFFLLLLNIPKWPLHARNYFKNKIFWNRITKKPWKSQLYFFFQTQFLLMDKVIKNKGGLELGTSRFSGCKASSEKFLY